MARTFFLDWELWQQMTFGLGCCIALVFCLGSVRLWWNNRSTRKLEILNAEKRARRSNISCCGMKTGEDEAIPFGVRALERGVEVEGIWISKPEPSDVSQTASSATLMGDQADQSPSTKVQVLLDHAMEAKAHIPSLGDAAAVRTNLGPGLSEEIANSPSRPATAEAECSTQHPYNCSESREVSETPPTAHAKSYIPSGTQVLQGRRHPTPPALDYYTDLEPQPWGVQASVQEFALFGPARIHANTAARRLNDGFEILPAGSLGIRRDIHNEPNDPGSDENEEALRFQYTQLGPSRHRLRKKPPVSQLR